MAGVFSALELKQDGDVSLVQIKHSAVKPTLKDLQKHFKKKTAPTILTSYPYGAKRISIFGYITGSEEELSQHQLPPPCEASEIYGNIILISHSNKATWDSSVTLIDPFLPADYEAFYEKACSGELEEEEEEEEEAVEEEEEELDEVVEEGEEGEEELLEVEEEEEAPRPRVSRKVAKIDPQQLQFQFKSVFERTMQGCHQYYRFY